MKKTLWGLMLLATTLFAGEIKIAVAANVSYAIGDLIKAFNTLYPDTKVQVLLGSSGKLTAQIQNGAPYGLFMSANMKYPEALYKSGMAVTQPMVYAQGALALLSSGKFPVTKGLEVLKDPKIGKIAVANPKTAPYGKAAEEALRKSGLYDSVRGKFIYGESVSQTVTYAVAAADIGLVAKSALFSPKMRRFQEGRDWSSVDATLYTPISQGIVILKEGEKNREVAAFYAFIFSKTAADIFLKYGYTLP